MKHFQAWDQVIATDGENKGKAGVVQGQDGENVTVKFDENDAPNVEQSDNLNRL